MKKGKSRGQRTSREDVILETVTRDKSPGEDQLEGQF